MMGIFSWLFGKKPESELVQMQKAGIADGWYKGSADDKENEAWKKAVIEFKRVHNLNPRYLIGPITKEYILTGAPLPSKKPAEKVKKTDEPWIKMAKSYIGTKEIKGHLHNPKILQWWKDIGASWFKDDETPWCGGFAGAMLVRSGFKIPTGGKAARARSFAESPSIYTKLPGYVPGAIIVFWRGSRNGRSGHVGFFLGYDKNGRIMCLGANQKDEVNVKPFDKGRVLGCYWPKGHSIPKTKPPVLDSTGLRSSSNEA